MKTKQHFYILWHNNYWDGPLSGYGILDNKVVQFEIVSTLDDDCDDRLFNIYEVSHEEIVDAFHWQFQFMQQVGMHTIYDVFEHKRTNEGCYPHANVPHFFKMYEEWKQKTQKQYPEKKHLLTIDEQELYGATEVPFECI